MNKVNSVEFRDKIDYEGFDYAEEYGDDEFEDKKLQRLVRAYAKAAKNLRKHVDTILTEEELEYEEQVAAHEKVH